ncbi:MAG: DNA mismatch repair protein MutS [Patescibacteria group bacterium]
MAELTPMLKQYAEIKARHQGELLFFRLGDFYELFGDDAREASKILDIVLTARHKGTDHETPMCGIPHHALENYLAKLLKAGKRVAICDQLSDPTLPGIVRRDVTQVVTPGTTLVDSTLKNKSNNYIASLILEKNIWGLAVCDLTTGEFQLAETADFNLLKSELFRLNVSEVIVASELTNDSRYAEFISTLRNVGVFQPTSIFINSYQTLVDHFKIKNLTAFGVEELKVAIEASGRLLGYLKETQKTELIHLTKIKRYNFADFMVLDEATIRNLELLQTSWRGEYEGSLLSVIDQTSTSAGGRLLRRTLLAPLLSSELINDRLTAVVEIKEDSRLIRNLKEKFEQLADLERLLGKIGCRRTNGRDLVALKRSLQLVPEIKFLIQNKQSKILNNAIFELVDFSELVNLLEQVFVDEPSAVITEGGMIKDGFNAELDELHQIGRGGRDWLLQYQASEIERTKINSLKVRFNNVFGYYIEISNSNLNQVPADYTRKQTLANAERFIAPLLKEYEEKILGAEEKIIALEQKIFWEAVTLVGKYFSEISRTAEILANLDLLLSFAIVANENNYARPIVNNSGKITIKNGRHPVIEKFQKEQYVPNDLEMDHEKQEFILLTGPNMSGKSSFLRQTALICLMAQIGSFVPAETAEIGVIDRIFTRVGASDNLTEGVSTFMAEMLEAANILNNATKDSLIILDELGRGTSTYDGVSIALAIMEYLHDHVRAKTIFATHYHELTSVVERLERAENYSVAVSEYQERVIFLHKIVAGATSKSYGIEVARLSGLPQEIIFRAEEVLKNFEQSKEVKSPSQGTLLLK